jgi:hypothetical protein
LITELIGALCIFYTKISKKIYRYYHCNSACDVRYSGAKLNDNILDEIKKYVSPEPGYIMFFSQEFAEMMAYRLCDH